MAKLSGIAELTLQARDPALLERFYTAGFGLPVPDREDPGDEAGVDALRS